MEPRRRTSHALRVAERQIRAASQRGDWISVEAAARDIGMAALRESCAKAWTMAQRLLQRGGPAAGIRPLRPR
jgi:hypothetical protein